MRRCRKERGNSKKKKKYPSNEKEAKSKETKKEKKKQKKQSKQCKPQIETDSVDAKWSWTISKRTNNEKIRRGCEPHLLWKDLNGDFEFRCWCRLVGSGLAIVKQECQTKSKPFGNGVIRNLHNRIHHKVCQIS